MNNIAKKLSIAIYWHMHQPVYELEGVFYMPWARLHAVKDYLDMVSILEKFPALKLNFDIVPTVLDYIIKYTQQGFNDIHSTITLTPIENLTDSEKEYILNNFFNSKYETMVLKFPRYRDLFKKRFYDEITDVNGYTNEEYSDIIALFNLSWIDPSHKDKYEGLKELIEKGANYTLDDRIKIIDIHKQIMSDIIPTYKKYIDEGRIELTTSPYYHPILPILCDYKTTSSMCASTENLPIAMDLTEDAHQQVKLALEKIEKIFNVKPKGFWASEHCLTDEVLNLLKSEGVNWVISDESILSKSINFEFVRDFRGNLEDPYYLLKTYDYGAEDGNIRVIFRDSLIPNLINFEYCNIDADIAASDFYSKTKFIQNKLMVSPDDNHLLTIALDGENSWENYPNDGNDFLEALYKKLLSDDSIETVLISDYISEDRNPKILSSICPGSWIAKNFNFWIGEPVKNLAWQYLNSVRNDIIKLLPESTDKKESVMQELYIAEGSDWFWWYGEPNNSGQDNVFDFLFREHLKNTYKLLGLNHPAFLDTPITGISNNSAEITAETGDFSGLFFKRRISLTDGPVFHDSKLFDSISYGCNHTNLYFELSLNNKTSEHDIKTAKIYQFYIYFRNKNKAQTRAPIRVSNKTEVVFPILKEKYHNELSLNFIDTRLAAAYLSTSDENDIWRFDTDSVNIVQDKNLKISIPFSSLDIEQNETVEFFFVLASSGLKNTFIPKDTLIKMTRQ